MSDAVYDYLNELLDAHLAQHEDETAFVQMCKADLDALHN
jgi:hypothetical protein